MAEIDYRVLNDAQYQAVMHGQGPLLVLAGAGSGKTRVIIYRIAHLLSQGVLPETIVGVTFTNKAAAEMRERLSRLVGARLGKRVMLTTFHSLGLQILKEEHRHLGLAKSFAIYDTSDQLSLLREILRQVQVADRALDVGKILEIVLRTKRLRLSDVQIDWGDDYELAAYEVYPRYIKQMQAFGAVDFDDLILRVEELFQDVAVRARWQSRYEYLLVDEYQDTSPDQLAMISSLARPKCNITAVGDDDQAIYGWRGAAVGNILSFAKSFPNTKEVILEQNYRSTQAILSAANAVILHNKARKKKTLFSTIQDGAPVTIVRCQDGEEEATFVAEQIATRVARGAKISDIAVLYRSNLQSQAFEEALTYVRMPYRVVGGQALFDRKEVRDVLGYLGVLSHPQDEVALRRILNTPARGIGNESVAKLTAWGNQGEAGRPRGLFRALECAAEISGLGASAVRGAQHLTKLIHRARAEMLKHPHAPVGPVIRRFFSEVKLEEAIRSASDADKHATRRIESLTRALDALDRYEQRGAQGFQALTDYVRAAALVRDTDDAKEGEEATLMTLHSAKGLEFRFVYLVGVEEEVLPHKRSVASDDPHALEEERRLMYVGMTRAKQELILTHAVTRRRYGRVNPVTPSRFLSDLPEQEIVRRGRTVAPTALDKAQEEKAASDFFARMRKQLGLDDKSAALKT